MSRHPKIGPVVVVGIAVLALGLAGTVRAQLSSNGPEFQVNSYTTGNQYAPAVASDASGNFVVVWQSDSSNGTDSDSTSVHGRRYASSGAPIGDEFQINSYTTRSQSHPAVASDATGNFVVVWRSYKGYGDDDWSVQGQRYHSSGAKDGAEFQVNSYTTSKQQNPAVASDATGNFVVVWRSYGSGGNDDDGYSVQGQRYGSDGLEIGAEFQVNSFTTNGQDATAVASDANGNFVVVWRSYGSSGTDSSSLSIQGQRYGSDGLEIGGEFQVNSYTTNFQISPAVASDATGNFVVVWQSYKDSVGDDSSSWSVQGQRYGSDGLEIGGEFQVNSYTTSSQWYPAVASDSNGNFVVVWKSKGSNGTDSNGDSIQGQRYASSGTKVGGEFQVNSYTTSTQEYPAIASDATGNFVVAWSSDGSNGTDSDNYSVQGQRYDALFRDGFESNDTSRWSATSP